MHSLPSRDMLQAYAFLTATFRHMQFGEIDIDSELVAFKESVEGDQAIMMLNNGCICCTVKEDLLVMLEELVRPSCHHHL